ncbi:MAG: chemotaxis protein CheW [Novosphingobium sp.]|nr:chemotaxis protein CheW [Novosphingobium sp.]
MLAFTAGNRRFGIAANLVREVGRLPRLTPVPHAPPSLLGLGNLRGEALPVVSAARLLGLEEQAPERIVVIEGDHPAALAIERIDGIVSGGERDLPPFADLLDRCFPARIGATGHRRAARQSDAADHDRLALLTFAIGEQLFALPLEDIENVLRVPAEIALLPHGDAATVGTIAWRDRPLPLFSLAALLDLPARPGKDARIVVARIGNHAAGFTVDRIGTLLHAPQAAVDPVPAALLRSSAETVIQAIYRPPAGGRLVSVLSAEHLLDEELTATLSRAAARPRAAAARRSARTEPLLLIESAGQRLAFPLAAIRRLAPAPARLTPLPQAPAFLLGLTGLHGEAVPVIDLSLHLSGRAAAPGRSRLLVVEIAGADAALLVDAVHGLVRAPAESLAKAPPLGTETAAIGRVLQLGDGMEVTLVISPADLFDALQRKSIAQTGGKPAQPE